MVFSLHEPEEIEQLLTDAGFRDVSIQSTVKTLRLPEPEEFLWQYVQSTPLMGTMADVGDDVRAALERDVVARWQPWVVVGGLEYEQPITLARGSK